MRSKDNRPGHKKQYRINKSDRPSSQDNFDSSEGIVYDDNLLEGRNSVFEALKAGRTINKILVSKGEKEGSIKQILAVAHEMKLVVQEVDKVKLDNMSYTGAHQGVMALVSPKDYVEVDEIIEQATSKGQAPFIVILDGITDGHNLGSVLRTAEAAGVHGVIIPKRRAVGLNSVVSKASAGAIEYVPVARVVNIAQTIEDLKRKNIWVVGTDSSGDQTFYDVDYRGGIAIVIGSEGKGMSRIVMEKCDFVINIPMIGSISSLNASVAAAVVIYEAMRQRNNNN